MICNISLWQVWIQWKEPITDLGWSTCGLKDLYPPHFLALHLNNYETLKGLYRHKFQTTCMHQWYTSAQIFWHRDGCARNKLCLGRARWGPKIFQWTLKPRNKLQEVPDLAIDFFLRPNQNAKSFRQ